MTDKELETLKNKLVVASEYIENLQKRHKTATGSRFILAGPVSNRKRKRAAALVAGDILQAVDHV